MDLAGKAQAILELRQHGFRRGFGGGIAECSRVICGLRQNGQ